MMKNARRAENPLDDAGNYSDLPVCGNIMPIADTNGYPNGHWQDVYSILQESAVSAGFNPNLVSFDSDIGVIQKRIIQNIYSNPIVICDISSRNPNVMFELGMRLAFDKPTIIVKDEETPYSFDISSIEHLNYPADLRYKTINEFKEKLTEKIKTTYRKSIDDPNFSTFLKSYGSFEVVDIKEVEVPESKYILSQISELKSLIINNVSLPRSTSGLIEERSRTRIYRIKLNANGKESLKSINFLNDHLKDFGVIVLGLQIMDDIAEIELFSEGKTGLPPSKWLQELINNDSGS